MGNLFFDEPGVKRSIIVKPDDGAEFRVGDVIRFRGSNIWQYEVVGVAHDNLGRVYYSLRETEELGRTHGGSNTHGNVPRSTIAGCEVRRDG